MAKAKPQSVAAATDRELRVRARRVAEALAAIGSVLKPLKRGVGDPCEAILRSIKVCSLPPMPSGSAIRAKATLAKATLAKNARLGEGFPADVTDPLERYAAFIEFRGLDPRSDQRADDCVEQAYFLTKIFSDEPPVGTAQGNVHSIAQLIFEAARGKRPSENGLLKAVRRVVRYQKGFK
jgi:hypothetical protein